jgi:sulfopyruvate decarboxylase subunit beta
MATAASPCRSARCSRSRAPRPRTSCILWENGVYQANGGHPLPARDKVDFAALALAAGYRAAHRFDDAAIFAQRIGSVLQEEGPVFAAVKIRPKPFEKQDFAPLRAQALRDAFKAALART